MQYLEDCNFKPMVSTPYGYKMFLATGMSGICSREGTTPSLRQAQMGALYSAYIYLS